jgi:hypothetical protein
MRAVDDEVVEVASGIDVPVMVRSMATDGDAL